MKIAADAVVTIDYVLTDDEGEVIDQSDDEPLEYLHGRGQLVAGLESQLLGAEAGADIKVQVAPADGYGEHDPSRVVEVDRGELPEDLDLELGMELSYDGPDGEPLMLWVVDIGEQVVTLDGNHPLAGVTLNFAVKVRAVRAATAEELAHGHSHAPGDQPH